MAEDTYSFQDHYPDDVAHCYGCGRLNEHGHQLKSHWEGEETVARYTPRPYDTAIPGYVYGGLIASLIDCHGTGSASAAAARLEGWDPVAHPTPERELPRFVTASLHVDYLRPTRLGPELEVRGKIVQATERKVVVEATLSAEGEITARGKVVAVRMPEHMVR
ncbi:MAG: thioesterase [Gemmatimonas sp. SG8_38_2]|nr:MAG: thioesterase [Gemmatimonas sp. SG8_38_2]